MITLGGDCAMVMIVTVPRSADAARDVRGLQEALRAAGKATSLQVESFPIQPGTSPGPFGVAEAGAAEGVGGQHFQFARVTLAGSDSTGLLHEVRGERASPRSPATGGPAPPPPLATPASRAPPPPSPLSS